jgi:hypothetical protein
MEEALKELAARDLFPPRAALASDLNVVAPLTFNELLYFK